MNYKFGNRTLKIPDSEIEQNMKILGLTKEEAVKTWLEDEGYLENEEQEELDKKAKESKITATIHKARAETKTQKERVQKDDPDKENLINLLETFLKSNEQITNVTITNKSKMISFSMNNSNYELNLVRKRPNKGK